MYLDKIKEELAQLVGLDSSNFEYPPRPEMGNLSLPLFSLAKEKNQNPNELAREKELELKKVRLPEYLSEIKVMGPYLNFYFKAEKFNTESLKELLNFKWNLKRSNIESKRIMLEFSNANTHKEYHIGHLRNLFLGDSLSRILKSLGHEVFPVSYINDFGIHTAKTIWQLKQSSIDSKLGTEEKGALLGSYYAKSSKAIYELEENEKDDSAKEELKELKEAISNIMKGIESRDGEDYRIWKESRDWSIAYFNKIYKQFNIDFVETFYESEIIDEAWKIVDSFLEAKILKKSQGAIIADLESYNLGVLPIVRSDQTALYAVADLALAKHKNGKYKLDESIYIVDYRQSLYFKQLAKIFELAQEKFILKHLAYEVVSLKDGAMSSRQGNIVSYDQVWNNAFQKALSELKKRHEDWSKEKLNDLAKKIARGVLRFEIIKVSYDKVIIFDLEEALRFDGYTSVYLQYTGARIASLLRQGESLGFSKEKLRSEARLDLLKESGDLELSLAMSRFPEIVAKAAQYENPALLAQELFNLAQIFNDYYHKNPILKTEKDLISARLALSLAVQDLLRFAFSLLGIDYLEEI